MKIVIYIVFALFFIIKAEENNHPSTFVFPTYNHSYGIRKAGPTELFLFMGFRVKFSNPQGLACVRLDSWEDPENKHDDDEVTVYGVNSGQNNIIYNKSMYALGVYGLDEKGAERLKDPHGITANRCGDVYVADTGNHRIVRLYNPGDQLQYKYHLGTKGSQKGQFLYPQQVALDSKGNVYIADTGNDRIQIFDKNAHFKLMFNDNLKLDSPRAIAVTDKNQDFQYRAHNFIIVCDSADQRITKFTPDGENIIQIRLKDIGFDNGKIEYACLDYYNQLLITDSRNHCIHKFDNQLNYITSFGTFGDDDYQFNEPRGITIYRRFGQLFVAEKTGAQYYWVGTDIKNVQVTNEKGLSKFSFYLTEPSYIEAFVLDLNDRLIKKIAKRRIHNEHGWYALFWDGRMGKELKNFYEKKNMEQSNITAFREKLPTGTYKFKIIAEATYSFRTYFKKEVEVKFNLD